MEYKGYAGRVEFDSEAGVLFGDVEGLRDVVTFEATDVPGIEKAFRDSIDDYLEMCAERGEEPEKPYSGKFILRVESRLHREVAMAAAREGKSLNAFASDVFKSWIEHARRDRNALRAPAAAPALRPNATQTGTTTRKRTSSRS
jgi:predicted HicB family RNase H-like nuclease